ncbi:ATP-binding cassette domain-containing protein [Pseudoroseomonas wenyumeiae]
MSGWRKATPTPACCPRPSTPAVLEAEGLGVAGLFEGASLRVHAGEVVGIYGFMGSGQLELARALSGKLPLDHGTVRVDGRAARLRGGTPAAKRAGIAFVPESRRAMLFAPEPVYRNISISILERISRLLLHPRREREIAEGMCAAWACGRRGWTCRWASFRAATSRRSPWRAG